MTDYPVDVMALLHLVRESVEVDNTVAPGRVVGPWLEIFEDGEDEEGFPVCYAYWVRYNPSNVARYDMVEWDGSDPDSMDLSLKYLTDNAL